MKLEPVGFQAVLTRKREKEAKKELDRWKIWTQMFLRCVTPAMTPLMENPFRRLFHVIDHFAELRLA